MSNSPPVKPPFFNFYIPVNSFPCPQYCIFLIKVWVALHDTHTVQTEYAEHITIVNATKEYPYLVSPILFNHFSMHLSKSSLEPSGHPLSPLNQSGVHCFQWTPSKLFGSLFLFLCTLFFLFRLFFLIFQRSNLNFIISPQPCTT